MFISNLEMEKFDTNSKKLIPKLSIKYLIFIIIIIIGCSYQISQLTQVFLKFETKVDVKNNQNNEIVIPMVSFCKPTKYLLRNSSQQINGLTPAQLYNQTFSFTEVFIHIEFILSNDKYEIINFIDEEQNNNKINYEKTVSFKMTCYHLKYLHSKQLKHKQGKIYKFWLYHQNDVFSYDTSAYINFPYYLFLTSDINYPNLQTDNPLYIMGNNFCL